MSSTNEEIVAEPITVVEEPVVVAPVVPEVKSYEYQPTDGDGRPIGGRQVIKYTSQDDLVEQLTNQSVHQIRKMREQERKIRLGIPDNETIEDTAPRFEQPREFKPRVLTGEERQKLSQDILDSDTFDSAVNTVFEASTGVPASDLRDILTSLQTDNQTIKAQREADRFMQVNPEYIKCAENSEAITSWMQRYSLAPVAENFQKAYDTLKAADVLVTSVEIIPAKAVAQPAPIEPVLPVEEPVDPPSREEIPLENQVVEPVVAAPVTRVATGLNRSNSSDAGFTAPVGDEIVYEYIQRDSQGRQVGEKKTFRGMAAIQAMPSEEYKRRLLHEKGFSKKYEKLLQDAAKRNAR